MAPGCKPGRREPYVGSNPTPCTTSISDLGIRISDFVVDTVNLPRSAHPKSQVENPKLRWAGVAQLVERQPSKLNVASSSLVSRSILFLRLSPSSSGVERILGKDEVSGSNPDLGSRRYDKLQFVELISKLKFAVLF